VPLVGGKIHFLLLGGNQVNANALLRFYVLHCVVLPLAAILFIAVHFWRIRKDGGLYVQQSEPKAPPAAEWWPPVGAEEAAGVPRRTVACEPTGCRCTG